MGKNVTFDYGKASCFISEDELKHESGGRVRKGSTVKPVRRRK